MFGLFFGCLVRSLLLLLLFYSLVYALPIPNSLVTFTTIAVFRALFSVLYSLFFSTRASLLEHSYVFRGLAAFDRGDTTLTFESVLQVPLFYIYVYV